MLAEESKSESSDLDVTFRSCDETELDNDSHTSTTNHPAYTEYRRQLQESTETQYFDPDQLPRISHRIRTQYLQLLQETRKHKKDLAERTDPDQLLQVIQQSSEMYEQVRKTNDATIDSSLLTVSVDISTEKANFLFKNSAFFSPPDYVSQLRSFFRASAKLRTKFNAALLYHSKRASSFSCLLGPIKLENALKEAKKRQSLPKSTAQDISSDEENAASSSQSSNPTQSSVETTTMILELYEMLQEEGPLNFFRFFINPNSFGQSVENLFWCSFLVREEKARIYLDKRSREPLIEAIYEEEEEEEDDRQQEGGDNAVDAAKNQVVMKLDESTWRLAVAKFGIKGSVIPHRKQ